MHRRLLSMPSQDKAWLTSLTLQVCSWLWYQSIQIADSILRLRGLPSCKLSSKHIQPSPLFEAPLPTTEAASSHQLLHRYGRERSRPWSTLWQQRRILARRRNWKPERRPEVVPFSTYRCLSTMLLCSKRHLSYKACLHGRHDRSKALPSVVQARPPDPIAASRSSASSWALRPEVRTPLGTRADSSRPGAIIQSFDQTLRQVWYLYSTNKRESTRLSGQWSQLWVCWARQNSCLIALRICGPVYIPLAYFSMFKRSSKH